MVKLENNVEKVSFLVISLWTHPTHPPKKERGGGEGCSSWCFYDHYHKEGTFVPQVFEF